MNKGFVHIFLLILVALVGIVIYFLYKNPQFKNYIFDTSSSFFTSVNKIGLKSSPNKIVFKKTFFTPGDQAATNEIWIMNTDGTNTEKISLTGHAHMPINIISDGWIYYQTDQSTNIYAYNFSTKQSKQIIENNQTNGNIIISDEIVSPDNKKIIYKIVYEETKEREGSRLEVDLYPEHKSGIYSYNIETDKKTYLGNADVTKWDKESENIYITDGIDYHEYKLSNGLYKININTGQATLIKTLASSYPYTYDLYPIGENDTHIKLETVIKDGDLINGYKLKKNFNINIIKDGKEVKTINSSGYSINALDFSPDNKNVIYSTSIDWHHRSINLINLETLDTKNILQEESNRSLGRLTWVSNNEFIIDNSEKNKSNSNWTHSLLLVDIVSGKTKILTGNDDAGF